MKRLLILMMFYLTFHQVFGQVSKRKYKVNGIINVGHLVMIKDTYYKYYDFVLPKNIKLINHFRLQPKIGLGASFSFHKKVNFYLGIGLWKINQLKEFSDPFVTFKNYQYVTIKKQQVVINKADIVTGVEFEIFNKNKHQLGIKNTINFGIITEFKKKYYQNSFLTGSSDYFWTNFIKNKYYLEVFFLETSLLWKYNLTDNFKMGLSLGLFYNPSNLVGGYYSFFVNSSVFVSYLIYKN